MEACNNYIEDSAICDSFGEPKGQCVCGWKWLEHKDMQTNTGFTGIPQTKSRVEQIEKSIQDLKDNQRLIMDTLENSGVVLSKKDLKIVRWAYQRRFNMLQHEKQIAKKRSK